MVNPKVKSIRAVPSILNSINVASILILDVKQMKRALTFGPNRLQ